MTYNTPQNTGKIKVGYTMERVEQYVPNPLRCYKCPKYNHHEDNCRGREVCWKCGQQGTDHHINECELPNKCVNCGSDHLVYTRSCDSWKLEKEIRVIKHKNNFPYHEPRKMVALSKTPTYSHAVQRVNRKRL